MRRAGRAVSNDDDIRVESFEVARGILQRLALFQRRRFCREVDNVRGESLRGEFEADPCAGRRFDEKVDYCFASQSRNLLDSALSNTPKSACRIQNSDNLFRTERLDIQQMFPVPAQMNSRFDKANNVGRSAVFPPGHVDTFL